MQAYRASKWSFTTAIPAPKKRMREEQPARACALKSKTGVPGLQDSLARAGTRTETSKMRARVFVRKQKLIVLVTITLAALLPICLRAATFHVTSAGDSGPGTLRQALADAADGDTIDATGVSGTILLTSGELVVAKSITIIGPGPANLTVDGGHASRVFHITPHNFVNILGLTIANGRVTGSLAQDSGGGIYNNRSTLTVSNCVLSGNSAIAIGDESDVYGGAIFNNGGFHGNEDAALTLVRSTLSGNSVVFDPTTVSDAWGGGIGNVGCGGRVTLTVIDSTISGNSGGHGGGISTFCNTTLTIANSTFSGNTAGGAGGSIYNDGAFSGRATLKINSSTFSGNSAGWGGDIYNNGFSGHATIEIGNTILNAGASTVSLFNDSGTVTSLGYNLSSDGGAGALNAAGDQINTDPMLGPLQDNGGPTLTHALLPGSPAIDHGASEVVKSGVSGLAALPCGHTDVRGTARPQDGDGDGGFECDIGAIELPGSGEVVAGHSGAFYNPERNGEGTYVEVFPDGRSVVYTFTYRPNGSGPSWFIGVGEVRGNAIVVDDLLRFFGTRFGPAFDSAEIESVKVGGMSMVFPTCDSGAQPGNVAYTGEPKVGYEGLVTRALRLSNITGCGPETPHVNAGLSGSYFDPARDGEGIVVEWLTSNEVLVIFFTYDLVGDQFWVLGIGEPDGKSVVMDALYPATATRWGSNFKAEDINVVTWGTFTLNWTDCDSVTFAYDSEIPGFGSAQRNYSRISTLAGTHCPTF